MRRRVAWLKVCVGLLLATAARAEQPAAIDPAHALAAKFSEDSPKKPDNPNGGSAKQVAGATIPAAGAKDQRPSLDYEMEMLKRARAENAERRPAGPSPSAGAAAAASTSSGASAAKPAGATPPPPIQTVTQPAASPLVVSPPAAPTPAASAPAPANAVAPPPPAIPPAPATAVELKAEPKFISPPATVEVKAEPKPATAPQALAAPLATSPPPAAPAAVAGPPAPRATILLVLETKSSGTAGGLQRIANPPDPIICLGEECFLSSGYETAARSLPRKDALLLKSSSEASASSCKDKTACVYRDVPVARGSELRLVDLSSASHDNHSPVEVRADLSCTVADDELTCDEPVTSPDHRIWIVPEATARKAGAAGLEDALAQGLPEEDVTRVSDK